MASLPSRRALALAAILMIGLLAACAGAGTADADPPAGQPFAAEAPAESAAAGDAEKQDEAIPGAAPQAGDAAIVDRSIVKTGELTIEVDELPDALAAVRALALELGGYVGGSQASDEGAIATLTLRLPADRFDEALDRLRGLGERVVNEATREEDVTTALVDLRARIENLRASEAAYRALVERATEIEDILAVQTRLDEVRGEIEQLTAQAEALEGQAELATLNVTLVPEAVPVARTSEAWDPGATVQEALAAMLALGQAVVTGLIWFGIVWLPIMVALALVTAVVLRLLGVVRRRTPSPPTA
jgi:hypothetical protein